MIRKTHLFVKTPKKKDKGYDVFPGTNIFLKENSRREVKLNLKINKLRLKRLNYYKKKNHLFCFYLNKKLENRGVLLQQNSRMQTCLFTPRENANLSVFLENITNENITVFKEEILGYVVIEENYADKLISKNILEIQAKHQSQLKTKLDKNSKVFYSFAAKSFSLAPEETITLNTRIKVKNNKINSLFFQSFLDENFIAKEISIESAENSKVSELSEKFYSVELTNIGKETAKFNKDGLVCKTWISTQKYQS